MWPSSPTHHWERDHLFWSKLKQSDTIKCIKVSIHLSRQNCRLDFLDLTWFSWGLRQHASESQDYCLVGQAFSEWEDHQFSKTGHLLLGWCLGLHSLPPDLPHWVLLQCHYHLMEQRNVCEPLSASAQHRHSVWGDLNKIVPHRFIGSGTIEGVALLE